MTHENVTHVIAQRIRDAIDGARSAGASLAKSAHELVDTAHAEPTPTAQGTSGRADLIDRETVRVLLTGANLSRLDGMLSAYGTVLRILDDARADETSAARARVEAEAERDAKTWIEAKREDPETESAEEWAAGAFDAFYEDTPEAIAPLTADEAAAIYVAALLRALNIE